MFYTVVKCIFNKYGEIIKEVDFNLEPMTLKEVQTNEKHKTTQTRKRI